MFRHLSFALDMREALLATRLSPLGSVDADLSFFAIIGDVVVED